MRKLRHKIDGWVTCSRSPRQQVKSQDSNSAALSQVLALNVMLKGLKSDTTKATLPYRDGETDSERGRGWCGAIHRGLGPNQFHVAPLREPSLFVEKGPASSHNELTHCAKRLWN